MKRWVVLGLVAVSGLVLHELWAEMLVAENVAATLLSRGAGARSLAGLESVEALGAVLFIAYRLVALPLAGALAALIVLRLSTAARDLILHARERTRALRAPAVGNTIR